MSAMGIRTPKRIDATTVESPDCGITASSGAPNVVPYFVVVVVLAGAAFTAVTLTSVPHRWRASDPSTERLNGKYASMQFGHQARQARRLAEEQGRLLPEEDAPAEGGKGSPRIGRGRQTQRGNPFRFRDERFHV